MNRLRAFNKVSQLASFEAGVSGPDLEAHLRARGYTLGHFPRSFGYSTLGGWIATRSSGTQSLGYGRIEQRFAGGRWCRQSARWICRSFRPRRLALMCAGGAWLRGPAGIITEATVGVSRYPMSRRFMPSSSRHGNRASLRRGCCTGQAAALVGAAGTPRETETNLMLAGHRGVIAALDRYLAVRGAGRE